MSLRDIVSIQRFAGNPQSLCSSLSYWRNYYLLVKSMLMVIEILSTSPGSLLQCLVVILFNAF